MKLLRDIFSLRALRRLLAGRGDAARRPYAVTVPAPLTQPVASNVIDLRSRTPAVTGRTSAPAEAEALQSPVHLALVSSR